MENGKRLIDANEFIEALENADADVCEEYPDCDCDWGFSRKVIADLVKNIPTIDAVEVVRCEKCQWFSKKGYEEHNRQRAMPELDFGYCSVLYRVIQACEFCSYGERKDNG